MITEEQKDKILEFAGWKFEKERLTHEGLGYFESRWIAPDGKTKVYRKPEIDMNFLIKWVFPKLYYIGLRRGHPFAESPTKVYRAYVMLSAEKALKESISEDPTEAIVLAVLKGRLRGNKVMELVFSPDTKHRKQFFTGLSFSHPAKMMLPLQLWLIENYTQPGDIILDPMAGSGTILVACSLGRHVICVELEQKFCDMMQGNWENIQQRGPQLGYTMGTATILQGDARKLEGLLVDKIVTSPPYGLRQEGNSLNPQPNPQDNPQTLQTPVVSAIITSPPYESGGHHADQTGAWGGQAQALTREQANYNHNNQDNIGNLKSDSYLVAMLQAYQSCHAVLRPGGLMILVTKNFIRNKTEIRLDLDTIRLCEQAGLTFKERHYRKLTSQSFWRIIYRQKFPDAPVLNKEDILIFSKR